MWDDVLDEEGLESDSEIEKATDDNDEDEFRGVPICNSIGTYIVRTVDNLVLEMQIMVVVVVRSVI